MTRSYKYDLGLQRVSICDLSHYSLTHILSYLDLHSVQRLQLGCHQYSHSVYRLQLDCRQYHHG